MRPSRHFLCAPRLRGGLELELFLTSTLVTRTELASGLLLDLDTLAGLLLLHAIVQAWPYAWMSCRYQQALPSINCSI